MARDEFVHSVLSVMETIMQHPALIATFQSVMTSEIAQSLSQLCLSEQGMYLVCMLYRIY